jgi:hypothetical protein
VGGGREGSCTLGEVILYIIMIPHSCIHAISSSFCARIQSIQLQRIITDDEVISGKTLPLAM